MAGRVLVVLMVPSVHPDGREYQAIAAHQVYLVILVYQDGVEYQDTQVYLAGAEHLVYPV